LQLADNFFFGKEGFYKIFVEYKIICLSKSKQSDNKSECKRNV